MKISLLSKKRILILKERKNIAPEPKLQALPRGKRLRQPPRRLVNYELSTDAEVNEEGNFIHFAMLVDSEPLDYMEALREKVWKDVMIEELKSIEKNNTWTLTQ